MSPTALDRTEQQPASIDLSRRDLAVDFTRVVCVVLVVAAHLLMVGVGFDASGAIVVSKPVTEEPWFAAATVVGQIMPLFFALGGFASITAWRSLQRRGGDAAGYLRGRLVRLVEPTLPVFVFFGLAIGAATLAGAPAGLLDGIVAGIGTPLWFLAAYLLCQWFVPFMARMHERAPWWTLTALAAGAVLVDAARAASGVEPLGLLNLVFVWLFVQQLGFFYADGVLQAAPRGVLVAIALGAGALLFAGVAIGVYSPDMLVNLNPPRFALGLLGAIQLCVLVLVHPALTALMRTRPARAFTFVVGSRLMTVYLWHLTCIIAITGLCLLIPGAVPAPLSDAWWASRPLVLLAAFGLVLLLSLGVGRFESGPRPLRDDEVAPGWARVSVAALLAFIPPFLVMRLGLDGWLALLGIVCFSASLLLVRGRVRASA
ncbi:acyltransferase [Leifsonia sp. NPDC058248]|uniref:acyltransferase family protein n=1 Tax=Leifsonia sp. NPDC058248 TaxID=3346402 RepID=UPI0036D8C218